MITPFLLGLAAVCSQWSQVTAVETRTVPYSLVSYPTGNWTQYSDLSALNCTGGGAISFGVAGATGSYSFYGIALSLDFITASDGADIEISLDGEVMKVDSYTADLKCDSILFTRNGLDFGKQHTVTFRTIEANSIGFRSLTYTTYTDAEIAAGATTTAAPITTSSATPVSARASSTVSTSGTAIASPDAAQQNSSSSKNAIIGGVVGAIAGLLLIGLLIWLAFRKRGNDTAGSESQTGFQPQPAMHQQYNQTGFSVTPSPAATPVSAWSQQPLVTAQPYTPMTPNGGNGYYSADPSHNPQVPYNGAPMLAPGGMPPNQSHLPEPMGSDDFRTNTPNYAAPYGQGYGNR